MNEQSEDDWISAAEALQINQSKSGVSLRTQILVRARDGIIKVRAQHYIVTGGQRAGHISFDKPETGVRKFTCHVLESNFFWAANGSALQTDWVTGDFSTWINNKWHCRAFGVQFRRSEIEAMVPATAKVTLPSQPQATLPKHTDAELEKWIRDAPITSADVAHNFYKRDLRFNGIKQKEFRTLWMSLMGTKRGRPNNKS